jgi:hypothetical protein
VHFCLLPYALFTLVLPLHIIYLLHLLSTNHKCTQPCYFPLLLKLATPKEKMDWISLTRSSRLGVAPVAVPMVYGVFRCSISLESRWISLTFMVIYTFATFPYLDGEDEDGGKKACPCATP